MGPAELLDYDATRIRAVVVEDASSQSHVAIVAKALGLPAVGQIPRLIERVTAGDAMIVDGETGAVFIRPSSDVVAAYADKVRFRAKRQEQFRTLRNRPAVSRDGQSVSLMLNAGLMIDMPNLIESGADGIGLFRTELQFMIASTFPRVEQQTQMYREVLETAGDRPVVFRTLDIGGDKALPYMRQPKEDNPALGWRAVRLALDRPGLFRMQIRAMLRAAADRELRLMVPMVTNVDEFRRAKALVERERELARLRGQPHPDRVLVGAMIEVPAVLFALDQLLPECDFASVGSNDLLQYLFAADRANPLVASRYDPLSVGALRALKSVVAACHARAVPLTLCGEMGGGTLEAMALLGLGFRSISMAPAAIGPVKSMILSVDIGRVEAHLSQILDDAGDGSSREALHQFAGRDGVEL